jgi:cytochrome c5
MMTVISKIRSRCVDRWFPTSVMALVVGFGAAYVISGVAVTTVNAQQRAGTLSGMARLSGTVTSSQPFKAAQVYIRNVDKNITYMVFTTAGQFRATAIFPGNYEVVVKTKGLESDVQKLALSAGENPKVSMTLRAGAGTVPPVSGATFASYAEIYPSGPGRQVVEQGCLSCHHENFLPARPGNEDEWRARLGHIARSMVPLRIEGP